MVKKIKILHIAALTVCLTACSDDSSDDSGNENNPSNDTSVNTSNNTSNSGQTLTATIPGQANIYASTLDVLPEMAGGAGVLPPSFSFLARAGQVLTIESSSGTVNCCSSTSPADSPDGTSGFDPTNLSGFQDLSGIVHPSSRMFLSAVFTNGRDSDVSPPASLDYNDLDSDSTVEFFPLVNQVFFVGDGLTSDGTVQSFFIPDTATAVSFGVADGFAFSGDPGYYDDNTGEWQITFRLD